MSSSPSNKTKILGIALFCAILICAVLGTVYYAKNWSPAAKARKLKNPVAPTADALAAGLRIYTDHCRNCHGLSGDGKGEKAAELSVAPQDFTNASMLRSLSDGELFWEITKGQLPMPAFEDKLTEEQRWQAVDYIRTFAEGKPKLPSVSSSGEAPPAR